MNKNLATLLVINLVSWTLVSQRQICDTTVYAFLEFKRNTQLPVFKCDVYIVNENTKERFLYIQNEYQKSLHEGLLLDSLLNTYLINAEKNSNIFDSIFKLQKLQIEKFNESSMKMIDYSVQNLELANHNINKANESITKALYQLNKSKKNKLIYLAIGVLSGSLAVALIK